MPKKIDNTFRDRARTLRLSGMSIGEIFSSIDEVDSEATIWNWVRDIEIDPETMYAIRRRGAIRASKTVKRNGDGIRKYWLDISRGYKEYWGKRFGTSPVDKMELAIIGATIYWCEGSKNKNTLVFANSDKDMAVLFVRWLKEIMEVSTEDIVCTVSARLNNGLSMNEIVDYWSNVLNVPTSQFRRYPSLTVTRESSGKKKNIWKYGIVSVSVKKPRKVVVGISTLLSRMGKIDQIGLMV